MGTGRIRSDCLTGSQTSFSHRGSGIKDDSKKLMIAPMLLGQLAGHGPLGLLADPHDGGAVGHLNGLVDQRPPQGMGQVSF